MPVHRNKFLNKNPQNQTKFPSYEPNTPFISLADYNQQLNSPVTAKKLPKTSENITYEKPQNAVTSQLFSNTTQPNMGVMNADDAKKTTSQVQQNNTANEQKEIDKNFYVQQMTNEEMITYSKNLERNTNVNYSEQNGNSTKHWAENNNTQTEASVSIIKNTVDQINEETIQGNQENPPPKYPSANMTSPNATTEMHLQSCIPSTSVMPNGFPPLGEITQVQTADDEQQITASHEVMEQNSERNSRTMAPLSFSETLKGTVSPAPRIQKIIRMKIVPPFRREHFQYPQLLQEDIGKAMSEILGAFQPKFRQKVTISRTNLQQQGRNLQILMVTAPGEAEEDVARAKLVGIKMMGKTVFPTGDEFWRFSPGEFPKRAMIRITNLPALLETDELEELLELPPETDFRDLLERETIHTEAGKVHTGRGRIPITIKSKEHQERLFQWSMRKNSVDGQLIWNEVPVFMSIPRLHKCTMCEAEGRHQFVGHDDRWCRIVRKTTNPLEEDEMAANEVPQHQAEAEAEVQTVVEGEITQQERTEAEEEKVNENSTSTETDEDNQSSEEEDNCNRENENKDTTKEGEAEDTGNKWKPAKKKKRKRSKESSNSKKTITSKTEGPKRKSRNYNIND